MTTTMKARPHTQGTGQSQHLDSTRHDAARALNDAQVLDAAKAFIAAGWAVLPCRPTGRKAKAPLVEGGYKAATMNPLQVLRWWQQWPSAMLGVVPPPGVVVIDIDPRNGGTVNALEAVNGGPLPETLAVRTGSGGLHLYFSVPDSAQSFRGCLRHAGTTVPGIDVKQGTTGYVIAPPSLHPDTGAPYEWANGSPIAPLPPRLLTAATRAASAHTHTGPAKASRRGPTNRQKRGAASLIASFQRHTKVGQRNRDLFRYACRLYEEGHDESVIGQLAQAAQAVGLDSEEIAATIASARKRVTGQ